MTLVVVNGATLQCSHGGQIPLAAGDSRLSVAGSAVVISGMEAGLSFATASPPCNNKTTTAAPAPAPCVTAAATAGQAAKLLVGGIPVLLATATGLTVPAVTPAAPGTWSVISAGQAKLEAL